MCVCVCVCVWLVDVCTSLCLCVSQSASEYIYMSVLHTNCSVPIAISPCIGSPPGCLLVVVRGQKGLFCPGSQEGCMAWEQVSSSLCTYICTYHVRTYHDVSAHFLHCTLYYTCLHTVHVCVRTCMLMPSGAPESSGGRVPSGAGPAALHQCHSQYCDGTAQVPERGDLCGTRAVQGQRHTV